MLVPRVYNNCTKGKSELNRCYEASNTFFEEKRARVGDPQADVNNVADAFFIIENVKLIWNWDH